MSDPRDLRDSGVPGDLRALLADAVADVEPDERLGEIRARVAAPRRTPWVAVGGAALAVAASVVVAVGVRSPQVEPGPASPSPSALPTSPDMSGTVVEPPTAAYYLGDTPRGVRLFREWHRAAPGTAAPTVAETLTTAPRDPDYRTPWPTGSISSVSVPEPDVAQVVLADAGLAARPAGMRDDEARLALQQVVYTTRAALGDSYAVRFVVGVRPATTVLGIPVDLVAAEPELDVRAAVNISDPDEGRVVADHFTARGVANSPEATVPWRLLDADSVVVAEGFATATGSMDRLYPWRTRVDVSGLPPGRYTFAAATADHSDGEGPGPDVDTRTVVVE